jgi:long-chain acyl-CoA synthetase
MLNLASNLDRNARLYPERPALYFADRQMTYGKLHAAANRVANGLRALGIVPGDRVALSCPNLPFFPMVYYGILKAGAVVVPLNVLFKPREVEYHLRDSGARVYFCFEGTAELPMGEIGQQGFAAVDSCEHFVTINADPEPRGELTLERLLMEHTADGDTAPTSAEHTALVLYTSGTTGQPKGAELSHSNVAMNTQCMVNLLSIERDDVQLVCLPLFHAFGQIVQLNTAILAGAAMVLLPRFEPDAVLAAMQAHGVTLFAGVPTMYIGLLNHPGASNYDLTAISARLRLALSGGASLPLDVIQQFEQRFDIPILEGYGLSETSPVATFNHLDRERIAGSVGQAVAGVEVRVVAEDDSEVPSGEPGEVVIRGHNVMKGYFGRPDATADAIRDHWFHSGDIGRMDERGNLYIVDRVKDMIIRGGYNVYPREIEEVLMEHPSIALVAVIGVTDATLGEEIVAYVVARAGFDDADTLRVWARERLAEYKYPRHIEFRDVLPMTATGKLLKKALKAEQQSVGSTRAEGTTQEVKV